MKTISIQVPDNFQLPDNYEIKVVERKPKFKKGDVIVSNIGSIAIYEKTIYRDSNRPVIYYNTIYNPTNGVYKINKIDCGIGYASNCRFANETEINTLIDALKAEIINKTEKTDDARKVLKETFNITVDPIIRNYQDLIDNNIKLKGYWISPTSKIIDYASPAIKNYTEDMAATEKVAKSMLAMAMISQLMPYYGGAITDEEWNNGAFQKYVIKRYIDIIKVEDYYTAYHFLAFHTAKQRDEFLKYNERLIKNYLMID